jgi:hypothetical protein
LRRGIRIHGRFALRPGLDLSRHEWLLRLCFPGRRQDDRSIAAEIPPQFLGVVIVNRAGMGQRLGDPELMQFIDDLTRLDFELSRQLIDSDLTHV